MTTKEMLNAVINANISEDVTKKAQEMLASAEKKNGKRSEQQSENRNANAEVAVKIANAMTENTTYAASEIKTLIADDLPDISTAKITAVCKVGVEDGILEIVDNYKVGGKGRAVKGYKRSATTENETE